MKKLIFVDNDSVKTSEHDINHVKRILSRIGLSREYIATMEIVSDFRSIDRQEAYKLVFSPDQCIVTWSMYTASHYNSLGQILRILRAGGSADIHDIIYIDSSGNLKQALDTSIYSSHALEGMGYILKAIEKNNILTVDEDDDYKIKRMRVDFSSSSRTAFRYDEIDLPSLLEHD